jgi:hypothetical protein
LACFTGAQVGCIDWLLVGEAFDAGIPSTNARMLQLSCFTSALVSESFSNPVSSLAAGPFKSWEMSDENMSPNNGCAMDCPFLGLNIQRAMAMYEMT